LLHSAALTLSQTLPSLQCFKLLFYYYYFRVYAFKLLHITSAHVKLRLMFLVPPQASHIMKLDTQAVFCSRCWSMGMKIRVPIHPIIRNVPMSQEIFSGCPKVPLFDLVDISFTLLQKCNLSHPTPMVSNFNIYLLFRMCVHRYRSQICLVMFAML
jgi:hypothetical protein